MKPEFYKEFSEGKGGFTRGQYNIRRGGYLIMLLEYKDGSGGEKSEKN